MMAGEKVLLQETLIGCSKALTDVLAITHPVAFGRTGRVQLGTLLAPKGFEVSETFVERMRNFGAGILAEKIKSVCADRVAAAAG